MSNICINFCKWIAAMEPDDESCLDLIIGPNLEWGQAKTSRLKFILTTMRCFNDLTALFPEISDAPQAVKITWCQRNLERIRNISSSAIENANPRSHLRTVRLELYLYSIVSFMFDVEWSQTTIVFWSNTKTSQLKFILTTMRYFNDLTVT